MKGHNARFLADPKAYLSANAIVCYNLGTQALKNDLKACGGDSMSSTFDGPLELDLVPNKHGYVDLKILGKVGTYKKTSRRGRPLVGNWIPYLGQKAQPDPAQFGCINLATVRSDYVFSVGFTGCQFTVVQLEGGKYVYHEPTAEEWGGKKPGYAGPTLHELGPDYSKEGAGGLGVLKRSGTGWKVFVQTVHGVKVTKVDEYDL